MYFLSQSNIVIYNSLVPELTVIDNEQDGFISIFEFFGDIYIQAENTLFSLVNNELVPTKLKLPDFGEIQFATKNEATGLPPNNYALIVRSRNALGVIQESESYTFTIQPPYWQTYWFYDLK
ncbi:MAG: hypothetical protein O2887_14430 [Bacteroidetes bacterium]|nr:hypothetical protein [Bacteroidota bacterium]MDA1121666.1 hypothetical protein [Bacteroidota bacterium]